MKKSFFQSVRNIFTVSAHFVAPSEKVLSSSDFLGTKASSLQASSSEKFENSVSKESRAPEKTVLENTASESPAPPRPFRATLIGMRAVFPPTCDTSGIIEAVRKASHDKKSKKTFKP